MSVDEDKCNFELTFVITAVCYTTTLWTIQYHADLF